MWKERIHNEYQQPPSASQEPETGDMSLKNDAGEGFGEDVCSVDDARGVGDEERFGFNVGTDEVILLHSDSVCQYALPFHGWNH